MFRNRRLGVKEANAIEDIVVYESKKERGDFISWDEEKAYKNAWLVVERRGAVRKVAQPAVPSYEYDEHEDDGGVPIVYFMATPVPIMFGSSFKPLAWVCLLFIGWIILAATYNVFS